MGGCGERCVGVVRGGGWVWGVGSRVWEDVVSVGWE